MIVPWLLGIVSFKKSPFVWLIVFLNVFLFIFFYGYNKTIETGQEKLFQDSRFVKTQGRVFASHVLARPEKYSLFLTQLSGKAAQGSEVAQRVLASVSLKSNFVPQESLMPKGDEVALELWSEKREIWEKLKESDVLTHSGLTTMTQAKVFNYFSYQFFHGGFFHLLVNMFFLIIFGTWVERKLSGRSFLVVFLLSGAAGALGFHWLTGLSQAPLVGASGAVNGLIGFFTVLCWNKKENFFYFLLPTPKYSGAIQLPVWIFSLVWIVGDLASWLATYPELGGVAYAAHLSGFFFGALFGGLHLFFSFFRSKATPHRVL